MTRGFVDRVVEELVPENLIVHTIEDDGFYRPTLPPLNVGSVSLGSVGAEQHKAGARPGDSHIGVISPSAGDFLIYGRVWLTPTEIDAGFITEESETDIKIWNANIYSTVDITAVSSILPDGTDFSLTSVPITLGIDEEKVYTMTIEQSGPPVQETYYTITIGGIDYEVYIHGTRVIAIDEEANWLRPPEMRYAFQTVIAVSPTFVEQRRALTHRMIRETLVRYTINSTPARRLSHTLMYGHDKVFGVPIYNEVRVLSAGVITGGLSLPIIGTTTDLWNLTNLCNHVLIADYGNDIIEIKEIDSVGASAITLERGLINNFPIGASVYPCFFASLKAIRLTSKTDDYDEMTAEFKEFLIGSTS